MTGHWLKGCGTKRGAVSSPDEPRATQKNAVPFDGDGETLRHTYRCLLLIVAVVLGVMTARLGMVFFSVAGVAMGAVGVVRGLLVIAGFVMLGGFTVMLGGVLVMFGGLVMMVDGVLAHVLSRGDG
jgi:hypothetical protein